MRKIYTLLCVVLCTFCMSNKSLAQVDITFAVDMSWQTVSGDGVTLSYEVNAGGTVDVAMTDADHDGIYEVVASLAETDAITYTFFNGNTSTGVEEVVPGSCSTGGDRTYTVPAGAATVTSTFNYCGHAVYESAAWSGDTPDAFTGVRIKDDLTTSADLTTGPLKVEADLVVAAGHTLDVKGDFVVIESEVVFTEDFENVPGDDDELVFDQYKADIEQDLKDSTEITTSANAVQEGTKGLSVAYGGVIVGDNKWSLWITSGLTLTEGTYEFSYWARVENNVTPNNKTNINSWLRANNWNSTTGNNVQAFANLGTSYTKFSASATVYPGASRQLYWEFRIANSSTLADTFYIDNLKIERLGGSVIVNSGGSLVTYDANTNVGNVTINRTTSFAGDQYSFVSTPVASDPTIVGASLGSFVYGYDETVGYDSDAGLSRWVDASAMQLEVGKGYTQAGQSVISFTGAPNDGTVTVAGLTKTTTGTASAADQGWHLLGNPYPAAIDVAQFIAGNGNIAGSISIWDDGGSDTGRGSNADYLTANAIGTVGAPNTAAKNFEGYIGAMQGFFVQANTDAISVSFTEAMRVSGNNADANFFREGEKAQTTLKLALESGDGAFYNETLIGMLEDATLGNDRLYDAAKLKGNNSLQFYSYIDKKSFAIQGVPNVNDTEVSLGYDFNNDASDLTLKVVEMKDLEEGMTFLLTDHVTGKVYDLSETASLKFSSAVGTDIARFSVKYALNQSIDEAFSTLSYKLENEVLKVSLPENVEKAQYMLYDMVGKSDQYQSLSDLSDNELSIPVSGIEGLKILKVVSGGNTHIIKILF